MLIIAQTEGNDNHERSAAARYACYDRPAISSTAGYPFQTFKGGAILESCGVMSARVGRSRVAASKKTQDDDPGSDPEGASQSFVQEEARAEQAARRDATESSVDISRSVDVLRTRLGSATAYLLVAELLSDPVHSDYGEKIGPFVEVGDAPEGAKKQTVDSWIEEVRPIFLPQDPGQLDGRKLVFGLALLDQELRRRLSEDGFLAALKREIGTSEQLSGRGRALYKADAVPTLSDQAAKVDLLGRTAFAAALAERLRDEFRRTEGPSGKPDSFMLHLEGPWGSGKTSLLGFLECELRSTPDPWVVVNFNAWKNQRAGAPWWLLISAVRREAVADRHSDALLRLRLRLRGLWWRVHLARAEIVAVVVAGAIVGVLGATGKLTDGDPVGLVAGVITSVVAAVSALHGLMSSVTGGSERGAQTFMRQTGDPMEKLMGRFNGLVADIDRPIAIFIDDLDRCRAEYVVDLLEGVQTIFREAPVAFVVAADRHWLYDAYGDVYGDYVKTGVDPGRPLGHLFLEKSFQLSTSVPRISRQDQDAFWERLLSPRDDSARRDAEELAREAQQDFAGLDTEDEILGALDRDWGETAEENRARRAAAVRRLASPTLQRHVEHTLTPLAPLLEPNPRAMKRLVNAYGVERAVQILEGCSAKLDHPREQLALWTILKSRWPLLSDYLSEDPDSLDDLKADRIPTHVAEDSNRPYLRRLFADQAAQDVARGKGVDRVELTPESLRSLIDGPGADPMFEDRPIPGSATTAASKQTGR